MVITDQSIRVFPSPIETNTSVFAAPVLVEWPQRVPSVRTVDVLSDQPAGLPFFEAHAAVAFLGPPQVHGDPKGHTPELPVLSYALDTTGASDAQLEGIFTIDSRSGQLSLTRPFPTFRGSYVSSEGVSTLDRDNLS